MYAISFQFPAAGDNGGTPSGQSNRFKSS